MAGTYRKIMHRPSRMEHKVLRYNDSDQALALSDEDIVLGRSLPPLDPEGKFTALQFEIQLGTSSCVFSSSLLFFRWSFAPVCCQKLTGTHGA